MEAGGVCEISRSKGCKSAAATIRADSEPEVLASRRQAEMKSAQLTGSEESAGRLYRGNSAATVTTSESVPSSWKAYNSRRAAVSVRSIRWVGRSLNTARASCGQCSSEQRPAMGQSRWGYSVFALFKR